jgi:hypothetical protein
MIRNILLSIGLCLGASVANATSFTVLGTDAVYGAGLTGNGTSTAPQTFTFSAGAGQTLTFDDVTGATSCCSNTPNVGPDGSGGSSTNVSALNGISSIVAPRVLFLAGVFVDSGNPPSAPAPAGFSYETSANPFFSDAEFTGIVLNQVFFIGDGLTGTGTGTVQTFHIPDAADTLLLGFVDAFAFSGTPSFYGDNHGSVSGVFEITGSAPAIPLPAGLPLLIGGLAAFGVIRRKTS